MLITQKHIISINSSKNGFHNHDLSVDAIKKLPEYIENPAIIFDSMSKNDSVCIIASDLDRQSRPILISIKPNGKGNYNDVEIDSNFITSMYGRNGFKNFFDNIIKSGNLLYINKEKSQQLFTRIGLQLPQLENNADFDTIIHKSRHIVNTFSKNNPENFRESRKAAPEAAGTKEKTSQLFTNSMHKEHYSDEFKAEADAREDSFGYEKHSNSEDYNAAAARVEELGAD